MPISRLMKKKICGKTCCWRRNRGYWHSYPSLYKNSIAPRMPRTSSPKPSLCYPDDLDGERGSARRLKIPKRCFRSYFRFLDIAKCHRDNNRLFAVSFAIHIDLSIWPLGREHPVNLISVNYLISLFSALKPGPFIYSRHRRDNACSPQKTRVCTHLHVRLFFFLSRRSKSEITHPCSTTMKDTFNWLRKVIRVHRSYYYLRNKIIGVLNLLVHWVQNEALNSPIFINRRKI